MKPKKPKPPGSDRDRICISGPPGFHLWLKRAARDLNTDMSKLVRDAIDDYLKQSWEGQKISKELKDELRSIKIKDFGNL